jgi:TolA-binding protein
MAQPYQDGDTLGASVWEEVLTYAGAHPADTRSPEALYWLVHITRYGHSHNHLSHKAFDLLHQRYPNSTWAKQTKYYYD